MKHGSLSDKTHSSKRNNYQEYCSEMEEGMFHLELEKLMEIHDRTNKDGGSSSVSNSKISNSAVIPRIYTDAHGLPVTYDAATHEKQDKAKSDGLSMLWHELLSPLTVIKGYTSTLLQLKDNITAEQEFQYIQAIETASNRMIRLMENLRDITRLVEPDSLYFQRISLPDLIRTVIRELQKQTTKHFIKLRPNRSLPMVSADPDKIEQVLNNLIMNAVKYTPHGGDIEIEVSLVNDEEECMKVLGEIPPINLPCFIVSIGDNGIGIPEDELDNIFERFYRVKNKMTRGTHGAGLGLYICKLIVEAHNGYIWARNRLYGGSVFHFSLPCN